MRPNKRILVVDDNQNMADTLAQVLIYSEYETDRCYGAVQAIEMLALQNYQIVITDIKMPDMNGIELSIEIQRNYPDTKVILITAFTKQKDIEAALGNSVTACLTKPVDIDSLLKIMQSF